MVRKYIKILQIIYINLKKSKKNLKRIKKLKNYLKIYMLLSFKICNLLQTII